MVFPTIPLIILLIVLKDEISILNPFIHKGKLKNGYTLFDNFLPQQLFLIPLIFVK